MRVNAPAGYNIYNAAAAVLGLMSMGFGAEAAVKAVETFRCGFGRMEKLTVDGTVMRMILVKNPAGSNQVLNPSFAKWHELSVEWLYRIFGQLTFNNESTSRMAQYMAELGLLPGQASGAEFA